MRKILSLSKFCFVLKEKKILFEGPLMNSNNFVEKYFLNISLQKKFPQRLSFHYLSSKNPKDFFLHSRILKFNHFVMKDQIAHKFPPKHLTQKFGLRQIKIPSYSFKLNFFISEKSMIHLVMIFLF